MTKVRMVVEIANITQTQAEAFLSMFAWMNALGKLGCSRGAKVFYDGDGNARARISIDGKEITFEGGDSVEGARNDEAHFDID